MKKPTVPSTQLNLDQEVLRLTFCGTMVATFFAVFAVGHDLKSLLSPAGADAAVILMGLSAAFGFVYLVSVASAVKFQGRHHIDRFPLSRKVSQFFYDASINVFGVYLLYLLVAWIDHHFLHLPASPYFWPLYAALFSVTYFVIRLLWAGCQWIIEWQYDFVERQKNTRP